MLRVVLILLLIASSGRGADLKIVGPTAVPRDQLVRLVADGVDTKAGVLWRVYPSKGVDRADTSRGKLQFAAPPGTYEVTLLSVRLATDGTTELEEAVAVVVIGDTLPPPTVPPDKPPPDKPPVTPVTGYYFLIVRADGSASPEFTATMKDPAWDVLRKNGHSAKDKTVTEAAKLGVVVPPSQLPAVVTLRVTRDGTESDVVREAIPLPTTSAGILKLPEGVSK